MYLSPDFSTVPANTWLSEVEVFAPEVGVL
jgi:hypothetical protein